MNITDLTFEAVADHFRAPMCDKACLMDSLNRHHNGYVSASGTIHWAPRGMTRRGLWNFLRLVARATWGASAQEAYRLWKEDTLAAEFALELGFRLPKEYADTDRARVRALLAQPVELDRESRTMIERWARR